MGNVFNAFSSIVREKKLTKKEADKLWRQKSRAMGKTNRFFLKAFCPKAEKVMRGEFNRIADDIIKGDM